MYKEPIIRNKLEAIVAINEIRNHKENMIAVDCEGVKLGRDGRLCLVQVATSSKVYLFDIVEGGSDIFDAGLRDLLEDPTIMKIIHDCRKDSDALFHQYQCSLANVFDIQLAHTLIKQGNGEQIPFPVGLKTLLSYHGYSNEAKDNIREKMNVDPEFWAKRPLSKAALKYARQDVKHLCNVQKQLNSHLNYTSREKLALYSNIHIRQIRDSPFVDINMKGIVDKTGHFVPLYGIEEWDEDIKQALRRKGRL